MENLLVCKDCGGSKAVAYKYERRDLGNGLTEWTLIPQGPPDIALLETVMPEAPPKGYRLTYAWGEEVKTGRMVRCVRVRMEKCEDAGATAKTGTVDLAGKTAAELSEIAVRKGVTDALPTWAKAKLIAAIEGVK